MRTAFFDISGVKLEFLQATSEDSPVARFIEKKGEGLHHIAFRVSEIETVLSNLRKLGLRVVEPAPRMGAGGKKVVFLHPENFGFLVELCEAPLP